MGRGHSRLFTQKRDEGDDDRAVHRPDAICPAPAAIATVKETVTRINEDKRSVLDAGDNETHHERGQERRDDEAHGPEVKLW